jgi:hypothetical protein
LAYPDRIELATVVSQGRRSRSSPAVRPVITDGLGARVRLFVVAPPEDAAERPGQPVDLIVMEPVLVAAVITCVDAWSRVTLTWMVPTVAVAFTA